MRPDEHVAETYRAALESLGGGDDMNNHDCAAEWLCRYGGEDGRAEVVRFLQTRDSLWLYQIAYRSIKALGDEAWPVMEAARNRGIQWPADFVE